MFRRGELIKTIRIALAIGTALLSFDQLKAESCTTSGCHSDLLGYKFIHGPIKGKGCTICHLPAEGRIGQHDGHPLLKPISPSQVEGMCFTCHERFEDEIEAIGSVHKVLKEKTCLQCHDPHGSNFKHLLKDAGPPDSCLNCHSSMKTQINSFEFKHVSLDPQHSCTSCHVAHMSAQKHLLRKGASQLCRDCHTKSIETKAGVALEGFSLSGAVSIHKPVREGQCAACHQPHGSKHAGLLKKNLTSGTYLSFDETHYALCFSCHESSLVSSRLVNNETEFRNQNSNLHYIHVVSSKGRNCSVCHEAHSSQHSKLMKSNFKMFGVSTPLDFRPSPNGGSCVTACHGEKFYDRQKAVKNNAGR